MCSLCQMFGVPDCGKEITTDSVIPECEELTYSRSPFCVPTGTPPWNKGKKGMQEATPELRAFRAAKGRKQLMGNTIWLGRKHKKETKQHMSIKMKGNKNGEHFKCSCVLCRSMVTTNSLGQHIHSRKCTTSRSAPR